jgi:hypothetical protein
MNLPTLNMADWSILDYELAFDGIRHLNDAAVWLQNQPRSFNSKQGEYHPGADLIVQVGEEWCANAIDDVVNSLRVIRFQDPEDDDRRIRLIIRYEADYGASGTPVAELIKMALHQQAQAA